MSARSTLPICILVRKNLTEIFTMSTERSQIRQGLGIQPHFRSTSLCQQWQFALPLSFALFLDVWTNSWTRKKGRTLIPMGRNRRKTMKSMDFRDKQLRKDSGSCFEQISFTFGAHSFTDVVCCCHWRLIQHSTKTFNYGSLLAVWDACIQYPSP